MQHEYGIYGGQDGQDLIPLLNAIDVPNIVVLHTVLADPTCHQQIILDEIISAAGTLVTMTQTGRSRVLDIYGTDPDKVFVIPHGAAGSLAARPSAPRRPGGLHALTWGLLGPGKGIEHAIEAVAMLRDDGLRVDYTVAGQLIPGCERGPARPTGCRWRRGRAAWESATACISTTCTFRPVP